MAATLGRLVLYVKDMDRMIEFYQRHFGYIAQTETGDRIVELVSPGGGTNLMLHQAAKGTKSGQANVKLVFDVRDVEGFVAQAKLNGLIFGPQHKGNGYVFANGKDPAGNSISVSSRAYRKVP